MNKNLVKSIALFLLTGISVSCKFFLPSDNSHETPEENPIYEVLDSDDILDFARFNPEGFVENTFDEIYAKWPQYNDALAPTLHTNVLRISYARLNAENKLEWQDSSLSLDDIEPEEDCYLVFDYKTSFYQNFWDENGKYISAPKPYECESYALLYVDGVKVKNFGSLGNSVWRTSGVKLSAGKNHSVKWSVPIQQYGFNSFSNGIYLDNIRLVPASEYEKVILAPMGEQDVMIGGSIKFTASADWSESTPVFSVSGGGAIDASGVFTATTEGTYTVTAAIDGKTASNNTVVVHSARPATVSISGYTFTGIKNDIKVDDEKYEAFITNDTPLKTNNITYSDISSKKMVEAVNITLPAKYTASFSADGFFDISGTVNDTGNKYYIYIEKTLPAVKYTYVPISGTFNERIWLRFGKGVYRILLLRERDNHTVGYPIYTVENTCPVSESEATYIMPSSIVQSDSFAVSNAVHAALYGHEMASAGERLQLMYTWLMQKFHYDYISLDSSKRKPQDAEYSLINELGVCEGYANAFAAMARFCGIPAKVIGAYKSGETVGHAWNEILYNNSWYMADSTWDDTSYDPDTSVDNTYKMPYAESYQYFLVDVNDEAHKDFSYNRETLPRTAENGSVIPPYNRDMPDGWY